MTINDWTQALTYWLHTRANAPAKAGVSCQLCNAS